MSNWKVLIIDDEAQENTDEDSRYQKYSQLQGQQYDSRGFDLIFANSPDQARKFLKSGIGEDRPDIVLLDVRLHYWGDNNQGTIFKKLFRFASEQYVVALVSAAWDDTSMGLVRDFLMENQEIDQPLMFTFNDFQSGGFAAICTQIVLFTRRKKSLHLLEVHPGDELHILHLSDLHFGSQGAENTLASLPDINFLCNKIMAEWPGGPHFIAVTGDIGNTGHPNDYVKALNWLKKFTEKLGISLPSPRILLVPGNHDVSIPLAGAQQLKLNFPKEGRGAPKLDFDSSTVEEDAAKLSVYAGQPFSDFAAKVSSTHGVWGNTPVGAWTEFGFHEYGVVFSGFNTSKTINEQSWPTRIIDKYAIDSVIQKCQERCFSCNNRLLHISLSHHSPVGYGGVREQIDDKGDYYLTEFLRQVFAPQLLLHGHNHKRWGTIQDGNKYMIVGAPSPSAEHQERDAARGVNMLSLERDGSKVKKIHVSSLVHSEPGWKIDDLPNIKEFDLTI